MNVPNAKHATKVYCNQDMADPELVPVAGGLAAVFSGRSPIKESPNEDAAAIIPIDECTAVLLVADGLGGSAKGEEASRIAIDELNVAVKKARSEDMQLRTAIMNGIERANDTIQALGVGAGATLAVVELRNGTLRPYHVGDSMVLVVGGQGKIKLQTVSHSPVGYGVESGLLDESDAIRHEDRHVVSNFIGTPQMHIDVGPSITLAKRDTALLASDGLFDNLLLAEIVECIRKGSLQESLTRLVAQSQQRMGDTTSDGPSKPDDITAIVFRGTA
jgi:serine/threonine protein phosphatase PrpC